MNSAVCKSKRDIEGEVFELIRTMTRTRINLVSATELQKDIGLSGDDAWEFLESYALQFKVDMSEFKFDHYFSGEGIHIGQIFLMIFGGAPKRAAITIKMLVDAAVIGKWPVKFSEGAGG